MNKNYIRKLFLPIIIFFIIINALCLVFAGWLDKKQMDHTVLLGANLILFILTLVACSLHIASIKNNNPYAFVRGVTLASLLKLLVIAASVLIYIFTAKTKSMYAIAASMLFYVVYTIFEVKGAIRLNHQQNAKN